MTCFFGHIQFILPSLSFTIRSVLLTLHEHMCVLTTSLAPSDISFRLIFNLRQASVGTRRLSIKLCNLDAMVRP